MRIVYFGWDEFAVPTLMKLLNSDHEVLGVITTSSGGTSNGAPLANPVEVQAGKFAVPVYKFGATDASNILKEIQNLKAELGIVVSFGEECPVDLKIRISRVCRPAGSFGVNLNRSNPIHMEQSEP